MLRNLYCMRVKSYLSIRQLSEISGVAKSSISSIENGISIPKINTVCALANALNMKPEELFLILIRNEEFSVQN